MGALCPVFQFFRRSTFRERFEFKGHIAIILRDSGLCREAPCSGAARQNIVWTDPIGAAGFRIATIRPGRLRAVGRDASANAGLATAAPGVAESIAAGP
jgi:hypothetical protein